MRLSPPQRRALASVGDWGGINATNRTFRSLKNHELVDVDMRTGRVTLTDKGRAALSGQPAQPKRD